VDVNFKCKCNIPIFDKYNKNNGIPTMAYKIVAILPCFVMGAILPYPEIILLMIMEMLKAREQRQIPSPIVVMTVNEKRNPSATVQPSFPSVSVDDF
jgi:hypothetical protein